ncbi:hypothetical protein WKI65_38225 [Streptomyces sp. MS1.AVA.3]|uniref:hypothetical protein n=1 Tax=Streptomyces decoyicus TaxID=249567 RepID=UPI0030C02F97
MRLVDRPRQELRAVLERACRMCSGPLGAVGYLVEGHGRPAGRRRCWMPTRALACRACYRAGAPDPHTGLSRPHAARRGEQFEWFRLVGRGTPLPPQPCAGCGQRLVRGYEPLLRHITCRSAACRTALTRVLAGGCGSGRPCPVCGRPVTTGRADTLYDTAACQKAYRRRTAQNMHAQP